MRFKSLASTAALGAVAVLGALATTVAAADNDRGKGNNGRHLGHTDYVYARVLGVEPVVRYVTVDRPERQCWNEAVREPVSPYGVAGPTMAGTILGAAVGRQFGGDDERDVLTVIGAIAGGAIANKRAERNQVYRDVVVERCEVVSRRHTEQVVDGYRVTYEYQGRRYLMTTDEHPGDRVRLAVDVRPVGYVVARTRYR
jgi:uncharacterized protein YcfJ